MAALTPLRAEAYPPGDRAALRQAFAAKEDLYGEAGRGAHLEPSTRKLYWRDYGIWLAFLAACGDLDPDQRPAARVTPERLDAWVGALRAAGRQNGTIRRCLRVLHAVLRLIEPEVEVGFILKPRGGSLAALLPVPPKPFPPLDTEDVLAHARRLHAEGLAAPHTRAGRIALRDAALVAILLRRGPRVSEIAMMCLGKQAFVRSDGGVDVHFPASVRKNKRRLGWSLDGLCTDMLRDYLRHARPHLVGAEATDRVWLGTHGKPLDTVGVAALFQRRTAAWLGVRCGPHTARKWLRSTAARRSPLAAFDAAETMGHTPRVSLRHYAEATAIGAAQRHARHLRDLRRATAGLAERSFGEAPR